jgi:hypothetical protein
VKEDRTPENIIRVLYYIKLGIRLLDEYGAKLNIPDTFYSPTPVVTNFWI